MCLEASQIGERMPREITDAQREQWAAVHREVMALAQYFERHTPGVTAAAEDAREPRQPFRSALAGLREARNDLLECSEDLPGLAQRELDAHLRDRLGCSLDDLQERRLARLAKLRASGRLTTAEQYRLVAGRVEQIWNDASRRDEFDALSRLISVYEALVSRRRQKDKRG